MENLPVYIGAVVTLVAAGFYIKDTLKGETQPNRVSWLMWSVAPFIATVAALSKGAGWAVLPVFMAGFTSFLTLLSSFVNPKAYWKLNTSDYLCGILSVIGLVLWGITSEANLAIVFSIISDLAATFPTVRKAWKHPESESGSAYFGGLFNSLTTFFVVKNWSFTEVGFISYNILVVSAVLVAIYRKRPQKKAIKLGKHRKSKVLK